MRWPFTVSLLLTMTLSAGLTPVGNGLLFVLFLLSLSVSVYTLHRELKDIVSGLNARIKAGGVGSVESLQKKVNSVAVASLLLITASVVFGVSLWSLYLFTGFTPKFLLLYATVTSILATLSVKTGV